MLVYDGWSGKAAKERSIISRIERNSGVGISAGIPSGYDLSQIFSNVASLVCERVVDHGPGIVQQDWLSNGVRVNPVGLHQVLIQRDTFHKELNPGDIQLIGKLPKHSFKLGNVALAVVWRNTNAKQYHSCARISAGLDDCVQIATHGAGWNAAQPIVAAKFEDDERWRECFDSISDSSCAAFGRIATDTGVHHPMFVPLICQSFLQQSGPGLVNLNTITGTQAVAENEHSLSIGAIRRGAEQEYK